MRHFKSKFILSGAATAIVLMAVIISGPRNVFASTLYSQTIDTGTATGNPGPWYPGDWQNGVSWPSSDITDVYIEVSKSGGSGQSIFWDVNSCSDGNHILNFGGTPTVDGTKYILHWSGGPIGLYGCNFASSYFYTGSGSLTVYGSGSGSSMFPYIVMTDNGGVTPPIPPDTSTHFISVTPSNGTTTATTTTLAQDVYVNLTDLSSTTAVTTTYSNAGCSSFSGAVIDAISNTLGQGCSFTFTWDVESSGESSSSTPVTFVYGGTWRYTSTIYDTVGSWCVFGYCLFSNKISLSQVSGTFLVGQLNAYDVIQGYIASSSGQLSSLASSTQAVSSICNPISGSFSLGSCAYILIIPDASTTAALISGVSGKFLTYVPLGYVTRFIAIFASGTTTPLPVFSYTPPAVLGYSQGALTLNPWNLFSTSSFIGSLTSSTSTGSRTLRSIAEPYWIFLWTLVLVIAIIGRITGIYPHFHSRGPAQDTFTKDRKGFKHVNDETYRYKEQLYKISKRK
ncbi:MAG: hypothetical protein AB197_00995 [Parcubacteria bacterium C7867-002]|nr:MAG: hypothetical protein AB197_00995 [Parcubacteria bacterium C7867-002]